MKLVDIDAKKLWETEKAILIRKPNSTSQIWLQKSIVEDNGTSESNRHYNNFTMTETYADEKGLLK